MNVREIPELEESNALIGDPVAMRARWDRDGYLFFRDIIDHDLVARGRVEFRKALAAEDLIDPSKDEILWTGNEPKSRRPCDAIGTVVWKDIAAQPRLQSLLRDLMNEQPVWVPIVAHRSSLPNGIASDEQDLFVGRHQDGFSNEGIQFIISWIPMMDISRENGGLAVAQGMHKRGFMHDFGVPPRYPIPADAIPSEKWRTADFRIGDVLVFGYATPHCGLPNQTDLVRISIDVRAIPASAPKPLVGTVKQVEGLVVRISSDEGDVDVTVSDETYIRHMNPHPRVPTDQVGLVAYEGARVIAMLDEGNRASVLRPSAY